MFLGSPPTLQMQHTAIELPIFGVQTKRRSIHVAHPGNVGFTDVELLLMLLFRKPVHVRLATSIHADDSRS